MLIDCSLCGRSREHIHTIDQRTLPILLHDRTAQRVEFVAGSERFECSACGSITVSTAPDAVRFPFIYDRPRAPA